MGFLLFGFLQSAVLGVRLFIQLVDDILELVGIPGRTICVVAGILIANNPKLAAIAELAGAAALTGPGAAAAEAGGAAEAGVATGEAIGENITTEAQKAQGLKVTQGEVTETTQARKGNLTGESPEKEGVGGEEKKTELEREMETEEERPPEEIAQEKIFEQISKDEEEQEEDEENDNGAQNTIPSDNTQERAEEIKQKQQMLPKLVDVNEQNDAPTEEEK